MIEKMETIMFKPKAGEIWNITYKDKFSKNFLITEVVDDCAYVKYLDTVFAEDSWDEKSMPTEEGECYVVEDDYYGDYKFKLISEVEA